MLSGQDSAMIKETCEMIHNLKNKMILILIENLFKTNEDLLFTFTAIIEGESKKQAFSGIIINLSER